MVFSTVNPVIISPESGTVYTINEGESIQFECEAYGIPPPMLSFEYEIPFSIEMLARISMNSSVEVYMIPATGEEVMLTRGTAVLINATDMNSGNYSCVANSTTIETDQFDITDRVNVTLVVQGNILLCFICIMPSVTSLLFSYNFYSSLIINLNAVPPNITAPPRDLTVVSPANATFTCLVTGRPRPDITWMVYDNGSLMNIPGAANMDYQKIEEEIGDRERMSTLTLLDSQPSDAGDYVCVGRNNVTYSQESATLIIQGISSPCILFVACIQDSLESMPSLSSAQEMVKIRRSNGGKREDLG